MDDSSSTDGHADSVREGRFSVPVPAGDETAAQMFRRDPGKLRVLAHPVRLKILKRAQLGEVSAKEAASCLGEPIGKVSYHVRILAQEGFLELTRQTQRRGAIESHYRARVSALFDDETWDSFGPELRASLLAAAIQEWAADMLAAVDEGGFELEASLAANAHFTADALGMEEIRAALDAHYTRLLEIQARIAARVHENPTTDTTEVNVGLAFYGGIHTAAANAPFFARRGGRMFPLIPEYVSD